MNIILDLDNTLISSLSPSEEKKSHRKKINKFTWENMDGSYKVFQRPDLQEFLDYLFNHFKVSVWTAASKSYALFIIDKFILTKPDRTLEYIFFSHHCRESKRKANTQKKLDLLWDHYNLPEFTKTNTYIIDDHPEVHSNQPDRCIQVVPFEFRNRKSFQDKELLGTIQPRLDQILRG